MSWIGARAARPARADAAPVRPGALTIADLHERHLDTVYRYVARRIGRREDAEDVTAEVFAAAFQALARFDGRCPPELWLLGIARRKVADSLRRRARRPEALASDLHDPAVEGAAWVGPAPAEMAEQAEQARVLRGVVDALHPDQREALLLRYVEGLSAEETAVVMRRSRAAVNSLLQRARAAAQRQGGWYFGDESEVSR